MTALKDLPSLVLEDQPPVVGELLQLLHQQADRLDQLEAENRALRDEIARLKHHARRPTIKPSRGGTPPSTPRSDGKRPGSKKRHKTSTLAIHETQRIAPDPIPEGSRLKGWTSYTVQDIRIGVHNIRYELEQWEGSDGTISTGQLPAEMRGTHFGPTLQSFILYQYHHCHVTQPLLLEQLHEYGVDISSGQLSRLLTDNHDAFHEEKAGILATGLEVSEYVQVDDTGARHRGKNGYCTQIGNAWFSWFESTDSKSRVNFLSVLQAGRTAYALEPEALAYMEQQGLPSNRVAMLSEFVGRMRLTDEAAWRDFLTLLGFEKPAHVRIATEGALLGGVLAHGLAPDVVVLSDGAGQFAVFIHALCWIHAERSLTKLIPVTRHEQTSLDETLTAFWQLYDALTAYKQSPAPELACALTQRFEALVQPTTGYNALDAVLARLAGHQAELLRVLECPGIPLHNNGSEQAIREYVKRRKISGGTRSADGRKSRDTFTSLKQTCRKLGLSFWQYLQDRVGKQETIPPLADLIRTKAFTPG